MSDQRAGVGAEPEDDPGHELGESATGFRAFLLSDIRGYSSFAAARGDEAAAALTERFIAVAGRVIGGFGGESLGNRGDEVLFAFQSPRQAIRAAVAFERALLDATRQDPSLPMPAGIGIDVGEAVLVSDGWRANAINVAARLCSLASGGEILATREVTHLAQAVDGVRYLPLPPVRLKGISRAVAVVRVVAESGDPARGFAELGLGRAAAPPTDLADGGSGRALVLEVCPFKGLAFFDRADAEYFCGRERLVSDLLARLVESTLVGILGPSGIGKSSLLRAGVLPALSAGVLPGSASWRQLLVRPGERPCRELTRALDGERLGRVLERLSPGERIVVAVDQLEELFTVCELEEERAAFLEQLVAAARDGERRALVVCALRADFYGRLASFPEFAALLSTNHVLVAPMDRDELARAIQQPAVGAGLEVERALVDALVSDVAGEPGGLPLLSTTLLELWRMHDAGALRYERYRASGGVRGAVARLAEATYTQLDESEQQIARGVMLRLADDRDGVLVRRRMPHAELIRQDGAEPVVAALIAARLLTVTEGEVELAHEALLREWPRYRTWLEEDRAGRRLHAHLTSSAREWEARGRDPGDLYRGARLTSTVEWAAQHEHELNLTERRFLDASQHQAARATRRLHGILIGVGVLLLATAIAATVALISRGQAVSAQAVAKSRALAAESQTELAADPELSILLAIQATRTSATPQATYALREAIDQSPLRRQLPARGNQWCTNLGYDNASPAIAYSPSGREIAEVACDGKVMIINDTTGHVQATWDVGAPADAVAFSPDGRMIAIAAGSRITLLKAANGNVLRTLTPQSNKAQCSGVNPCPTSGTGPPYCVTGPVTSLGTSPAEVAFSPDDRRLAVSYGFNLDIWQLNGSSVPRVVGGPTGCIEGIGFTGSGTQILAANNADVDVIDAASGSLLGVHVLTGERGAGPFYPVAGRIAVSPNSRYVAVSIGLDERNGGEVELFDSAPWNRVATVAYSADVPITALAFSPDSSRLAIGAGDGAAGIWSAPTGHELLPLTGQTAQISSIAWHPDSSELATASDDGKGRVWRASPSQGTTIATGAGIALTAANTQGDRVWGAFASPRPGSDVLRSWTTAGAPLEQFAVLAPQTEYAAGIGENGRFGMLVDANQNLEIRDLDNGRTIGTVSVNVPLTGLSLVGDRLAAGLSTGDVSLYDLAPGIPQLASGSVVEGTCAGGAYVAISTDGQRAAAVGYCGGGILWNARTGRQLETFNTGVQPVSGLSLSPNGRLLAVASSTRTTTLFDLATKRTLHVLTGDTAPINGVAFSPTGTWLATSSEDGDVRIWDPSSGQLLRLLPQGASVTSVAFTPNGQDVVSTDSAGRIHIQNACSLCGNATALLRLAATRVTRALTAAERQAYGA
jgi:WD40 repeat protein/class 3 adenylate cyclase